MKKIKIIIFIIFASSLFSCFNSDTTKTIEKIDSLSFVLNDIETNYKSIDTLKIKLIYDTLKQDVDTISKYLIAFPKNKDWNNALSIFEDATKQAKHFFKNKYKPDIDYSKNQLKNLKTDIINNAIKGDSLPNYFKSEKDAINILKEKVDLQAKSYEQILNKYNKSKPYINLFIDSLSTTNNE
jgi:hypothetical protein